MSLCSIRIQRAVVVIACGVGFSACTASEQEPPADDPRQMSSPAATASPSAPTATPTHDSLPGDWTRCRNEVHRYTIGYPEKWHTQSTDRRNACRWFDPDDFDLEEGTEPPVTAITINPTERPYAEARAQLRDSENHEIRSFESVTIGDLEAIRFERVQTEDLLYPAGTQTYGYLFNHDGSAFYLETRKIPDTDADFEANKDILDKAAQTVEFGRA